MANDCWYCQAGEAKPDASVYASMVKVVDTKRVSVLEKELTYQHRVFHIPRCPRCATRRKLLYLAAVLAGIIVAIVLWFTIGTDGDTRVLAVCLGVLTWISLSLVWLTKDHLTRLRYPPIQEARRAGFRFGEPPPGAPRAAG